MHFRIVSEPLRILCRMRAKFRSGFVETLFRAMHER